MNYGRFFRLNYKNSDLCNGITVFDYLWLFDKENSNNSPEFPIYITISNDSINFHAHYHDIHTDKNGKEKYKHLHNTVLSLPLSPNIEVKDGLTEALRKGFNTNFPMYDKDGSNYLWKLYWKTFYWENREWEKSDVSYFELNAFVTEDEKENWEKLVHEVNKVDNSQNAYIDKREENAKNDPTKEPINRFIRKLILDFLFDLEHTKVFQNSPHYEYISVKLKENFFFNALVNKAKYFYLKEIESIERETERETETERIRRLFFLEEFFLPAEKQWNKSITNIRSDHDFTIGWFNNPEVEMVNVYNKSKGAINGIILCKEIQKTLGSKKRIKVEDDETRVEKERVKKIKENCKETTKKASQWQLTKYDFCHGLPVISWAFFCCVLVFVMSFLFCYQDKSFCKNPLTDIIVSATIVALVTSFYVEKRCKSKLQYSYSIHLFLPRLLGTIIAAWLMIVFASNIFPDFYAIDFKNLFWQNLVIILFLLFITGVFVYGGVINRALPYLSNDRPKKIRRTANLMIITFCYSYTIGIIATALVGTLTVKDASYKEYYVELHVFNSTAYISPGFLLVFTFVAMFIGLFINLFIEEKQIIDL